MTADQWQEENSRLLSADIARVRERLERLCAREPAPAPSAPESPQPGSFLRRLLGAPKENISISVKNQPLLLKEAKAADIVSDFPSATTALTYRLGLSPFEQNVVLLCAAMELDSRIAGLCAGAQGNSQKPYPTFALAFAAFDDPAWDALSPYRPLRHWRLIEINQPGAQPLTASALRIDERILNYLKGLNYLDDRLSGFLLPPGLSSDSVSLSPSQQNIADSVVNVLRQDSPGSLVPIIQMVGNDSSSKIMTARRVSTIIQHELHMMSAALLPSQSSDLENFARLWERESLLLPIALYIEADGIDPSNTERWGAIGRFLARSNGVFFLSVDEPQSNLARNGIIVEVAKPAMEEQRVAWQDALGAGSEQLASKLAGQFRFNLFDIHRIAKGGLPLKQPSGGKPGDIVWDAARTAARSKFNSLAKRIEPKMKWEDVVLPPNEIALLQQIAAQVEQRAKVYSDWGFDRKMNRGFGINALFAGESGTGKTMMAEVLANDLRLDLYRIDLSSVVNKYIGETEKNLRRVFDAAEDSGAILFFDEADALFGKRSEVKDSHDRYANIEVNYLLQRMEAYHGLAILATNMKNALDTAFLRRLRFVVNFPFPGQVYRKRLWEHAFPEQEKEGSAPHVPVQGLDFDRLSNLNLTGGHIHNIALNASFMAAQAGTPVTMPLVLDAARTEYMKLDRPINAADFQWQEKKPPSNVVSMSSGTGG